MEDTEDHLRLVEGLTYFIFLDPPRTFLFFPPSFVRVLIPRREAR